MRQILVKPDQMAVSNEDTVLVAKALGSSLEMCIRDRYKTVTGGWRKEQGFQWRTICAFA